MKILSDSVLLESKSARNTQLEGLSHDRAQEIISKVKAVYFAVWQGTGIATTEQVANFYEVPATNIRKAVERHRDELKSDGMKLLRIKDLRHVRDLLSLPSDTSQATVHTPRSTLRLGMVLEDSPIAKAVRTSLLDAVEKVIPAQAEEIERLRLQLALAQSQERLIAASQVLGSINPDLPVLILRPDVTVLERPVPVETTVMVDERQRPIARYDSVGISAIAQRYGFGKGNRANNACREWLRSVGIKESDWVEEPTAHISRKLPRSMLQWLDQQFATKRGVRQRLLGE